MATLKLNFAKVNKTMETTNTQVTENGTVAATTVKELAFSFRGTTNTGTIKQWQDLSIAIETKDVKNPKTGEIVPTTYRPDVTYKVALPSLESLLQDADGLKVLEQLLENQVRDYLAPLAADNVKPEEVTEVTAAQLKASLTAKSASAALKLDYEDQMKDAADVFKDYLEQVGKTGSAAKMQVENFAGKFTSAKLRNFANTMYQKKATAEDVLKIAGVMLKNIEEFRAVIMDSEQPEEVRKVCDVPSQICIQNISKWMKEVSKPTESDDLLNADEW